MVERVGRDRNEAQAGIRRQRRRLRKKTPSKLRPLTESKDTVYNKVKKKIKKIGN